MKSTFLFSFLLLFGAVSAQVNLPSTGKRLTSVIDSYPMFSNDGSKIVFQSNRTGSWEIFTADADGSHVKQLTNNSVPDLVPCWSPDGQKIVFASGMDNTSDIFIMNADGTGRLQLTTAYGDDSHPHFSNDGNTIFFNSARTSPDLSEDWSKQWHEIFSMNPDGSVQKQITHLKSVCTFANPSPDGKKIVFRKVIETPGFNWDLSSSPRNSEIFLLDLDSNLVINISNNAAFDGWPAWSPDGKKVVFSSNRSGPANVGQLYMYELKSKQTIQLSTGPAGHAQPSFSHDGKKLLAYEVYETSDSEYGGIVVFEVL